MDIINILFTFLQPVNLLFFFGGTIVGIAAGVLPGIGASLTMALLIPFTFYLEPITGLMTLVAAWAGAVYGGSISSILINTPGTGANVATVFDGFPMARKGRAKVALGLSATASLLGGLFGVTCLILFVMPLSKVAIMFGPPEYFLLAVFGLVITGATTSGSALKGLISAGLGLMVSFIGFDYITGYKRYTFGFWYFEDGIEFLIVVIGFFAVRQLLAFLKETASISETGKVEGSLWEGVKLTFKHWKLMLKCSIIGTIFGFAPGVGTSAASLVSYSYAKGSSDHPELFGTGIPEGVVAPESSNNAVQGGALIPTLTFGIPGNSDSAVFLAGLMMYGLNPGKDLFVNNVQLLYVLFVALVVAQFAFWAIGLLATPIFAKLTLIPVRILIPIIWIVSMVGTYALRNEFLDCVAIIIFGILSYIMHKLKFATVPFVMGVILGGLCEENFARAMLLSQGSYGIFVENPISWIIWLMIIATILMPVVAPRLKKFKKAKLAA